VVLAGGAALVQQDVQAPVGAVDEDDRHRLIAREHADQRREVVGFDKLRHDVRLAQELLPRGRGLLPPFLARLFVLVAPELVARGQQLLGRDQARRVIRSGVVVVGRPHLRVCHARRAVSWV